MNNHDDDDSEEEGEIGGAFPENPPPPQQQQQQQQPAMQHHHETIQPPPPVVPHHHQHHSHPPLPPPPPHHHPRHHNPLRTGHHHHHNHQEPFRRSSWSGTSGGGCGGIVPGRGAGGGRGSATTPPPHRQANNNLLPSSSHHPGGGGGRAGGGPPPFPPSSHFRSGSFSQQPQQHGGGGGGGPILPVPPQQQQRPTDPRFRAMKHTSLPPPPPPSTATTTPMGPSETTTTTTTTTSAGVPPPPPHSSSYSSLADDSIPAPTASHIPPFRSGGGGGGFRGNTNSNININNNSELDDNSNNKNPSFRTSSSSSAMEGGGGGGVVDDRPPFVNTNRQHERTDALGGPTPLSSASASAPFEPTGGAGGNVNNNFRHDSVGSLPEASGGSGGMGNPNFRGNINNNNNITNYDDHPPFRGGGYRGGGRGFFRGGVRGRGVNRGRGGIVGTGGGGGDPNGTMADEVPPLPPPFYGDDRFGRSPMRGRGGGFRGRGRGGGLGRGGGGGAIPDDVRSEPLPPMRGPGFQRSVSHPGGPPPPPPPPPPGKPEPYGRSWSSGAATSPTTRRMVAESITDHPTATAAVDAATTATTNNVSAGTSGVALPPVPPSSLGAVSSATTTAPKQPSGATTTVVPEPSSPPPLDTSALGDHRKRAEDIIAVLAKLMKDDSLHKEGSQHSVLPNKQLLFKAMAKLDVQTKQLQKQVETKEAARQSIKQAVEVEQELEAKESEQQAMDREVARQELEESYQNFKNNKLQKAEAEFEQIIATAAAELEDEIKQQRKDLEERLQKEMQTELVEAVKPFEADEETAQKDVQKANQVVAKTEARLVVVEEEMREKRFSSNGGPARVSIQDTVNDIFAENQRKASESHANLFGVYNTSEHDTDLVSTHKELEETRDPKEGKTLAEWADLTRQVTGLATALYSEPSESPYFVQNKAHFRLIEPIVKEYVRDSQTRLNTHFVELAEEYEYRRRLYKQRRRLQHEAIPEAQRKPASALIPRQTSMMILESGGSRPPQTTNAQNSNPYRRGRRNNEVRSEYEQEQVIAELAAKEAMEKKIAFGGSALPRQVGQLERSIVPQFINTFNAQKIDVLEMERDLAISNTWSDMEKCIFLDRFMQHPKDFRKIASFLRNKTAQDCVCYYYDSKKTVPYKFALKEFVMRRKRRGNYHVWDGTIQAAIASGAIVKQGPNEDKPLVFLLPESDETYVSHGLHPVKQEMLNDMEIDDEAAFKFINEHESDESEEEEVTHKRKADNLMEVAPEVRKYLKVDTLPPIAPTPQKEARLTEHKEEEPVKSTTKTSSRSKTPPNAADETAGERLTPIRKAPQKWTTSEKRIFIETLEKHGRKWDLLAQAVGTKTIGQIKNFYYDYKKQSGRGTKVKKNSSRSERLKAREGDESSTKGPPDDSSISPTVNGATNSAEDRATKEEPEKSKGPVQESKQAEPQAFPPSYASMLPQEVVSPLPSASTTGHRHQPLSQHALAQHQLEMASAPSLPVDFPESRRSQQVGRVGSVHEQPHGLGGLTEQQLRELALAQQIQALQQELAATRSSHEWGAPPVPSAPMLEPSRSDETARLLNHHSQSQHQHILSNLLPWVGSGMLGGGNSNSQAVSGASSDRFGSGVASLSDFDQQQLRSLLSMQQQQQQQQHRPPPQQHPTNLHEQMALSGLMNPSALRLFEQQHHHHPQQQQQQQQHPQPPRQPQPPQQQDDPRLELLRQLLGGSGNGGGGGGESNSSRGGSSYHGYMPR